MSWQTGKMKSILRRAKQGDRYSLNVCRALIKKIAEGEDVPNEVIIEITELCLKLGIKSQQDDAERN